MVWKEEEVLNVVGHADEVDYRGIDVSHCSILQGQQARLTTGVLMYHTCNIPAGTSEVDYRELMYHTCSLLQG